jgi:hypothetical protein
VTSAVLRELAVAPESMSAQQITEMLALFGIWRPGCFAGPRLNKGSGAPTSMTGSTSAASERSAATAAAITR